MGMASEQIYLKSAIEMARGTAAYQEHQTGRSLKLTHAEDPPILDPGAKNKSQYKQYGKTFHSMIGDCLQKDPPKR
jgi:hypothetical protein